MSEDILSPSKNNQTSDQDKLEVFWKEGVLLVLEYYLFFNHKPECLYSCIALSTFDFDLI